MEPIKETVKEFDLILKKILNQNMPECNVHGGSGMLMDGTCSFCENANLEKKNELYRIGGINSCLWGVPERFRKANIADFDNKYRIEKEESCFVTGTCGTGKTHLAVAVTRDYAIRNKMGHNQCRYINFQKLAIKVKCSFGKSDTAMDDLIQETMSDVLILDDIGCHGEPSPTTIDALYIIANERYEKCLTTIYTTNMNYVEIAKSYGDRIASRLTDCRKIELTGKDRRLK